MLRTPQLCTAQFPAAQFRTALLLAAQFPSRLLPAALLLAALLLGALLLGAACSGGGDTPPPTATPGAPTSPDTPEGTGTPAAVDAGRAFAALEAFIAEHPDRVAGTAGEREAAQAIAAALADAGYTAELLPFVYEMEQDRSRVEVPGEAAVAAQLLAGAAPGEARGPLVVAGLGRAEDLDGRDLRGAVLLMERGETTFGAKVANAEEAGAAAVILRNTGPERINGTLGAAAAIPAVILPADAGAALERLAGRGVVVSVVVDRGIERRRSQNVVATPGDERGDGRGGCRTVVGAHYDATPGSPGANDNASGVAALVELARTHRVPGLCMVAFGAEEVGLFGSDHLARSGALGEPDVVLNIDMAARNGDLQAIGDAAVAARAVAAAEAAGVAVRVAEFPPNASSDHVSFTAAGVPGITLHAGDDPAIHTPADAAETLDRAVFARALRAAAAILGALLPPAAATPAPAAGG